MTTGHDDMEPGRIYVDHAATTPLDHTVYKKMQPYLTEYFGNPSTLYRSGREVRRAIDEARDRVAELIGAASSREIVFTSGGSEADNMAILGVAAANKDKGRHIVISAIEHQAVIDAASYLGKFGFDVIRVAPSEDGVVRPESIDRAITDETTIVSVMHANNETGVIQPIAEIAKLVKRRGVLFHTDAVQTVGHISTRVDQLGCDLLALSAHKFYGPKGVGALYIKRDTPIEPLIRGGGQEQERRAGTENVAGIVGLAHALEIATEQMDEESEQLILLRERLISGLTHLIPDIEIMGAGNDRLPGHVNVTISGVEGESVLLNLDMQGIEASSGSACTSGSIEASHVLLAMGFSRERALGSVRMTLGRGQTKDDIDKIVRVLPDIVQRLRK